MSRMSRGVWVRFFLVVGLLVGCLALAVNVKPNLGLDLRGGAQFIFEAEGTEQTPASAENVDKTLQVLRGRVDALGVAESTLARQGENRILVELPGVTNDEEAQQAEERIGSTAKLTIHEVIGTAQPDAKPAKKDNQVLPSDQGDTIEVGPTVIQGEEISGASAVQRDQSVEWVVSIDFNGAGGKTWADITGKAACNPSGDPKRRIAIVLDGEVISSPEVNTDVGCDVGIRGGSTDITGNFTTTEAKDLAALIEGGALPLELKAISDRLVGPSLGAAAIDASIEAGIIGIALTGLFIIFVYRLVGFAATLALASYALLAYAMLAAGLLFFLGSGPIKGFGVTLSIGVIASMVSALIVARVLCDLAVSNKPVARRPAISGLSHHGKVRLWLDRKDPQLMKRRRTWLGISAAALVVAIAGIATQGLQLGVEFTGGRQLDYTVSKVISVDQAREAVAAAGFPEAVVQTADTADFTVRTGEISNDEEQRIEQELAAVGGTVDKVDDQTIGASLGDQLRNNALIAFGVAFLAQLLYLAIRFKWTFGVAAVLAMAHDVILVVGLFAWLQKPIDGIFLAAAMTIVGLSVNDSVVVFDRIRERWWGSKPDEHFMDVANRAAVETIPRTVNTGLGSMFILGALVLLGGDSLQDFAIALLVGLVVGTYSSVIVATPILTYFHEKWPMNRVKKEKVERAREDSGAVV